MSALTEGERRANDAILNAMAAVQTIDGERLDYNREELAQAIHVLQSFVKQHVLYRLVPNEYRQWYRGELHADSCPATRSLGAPCSCGLERRVQ